MEEIKVAINGFGRIGRSVFRIAHERKNIKIVGINDITETKTLSHLLKYDSNYGKFKGTVDYDSNNIIIDGVKIKISAEREPAKIPWDETPDVVIESTGVFRQRESSKGGYGDHLKNGAKKVLLTVPAKDEIDAMIVLGVNDEVLKPEHKCVSNASCTTNCLAPVVKVLQDEFGINEGLMTTVHSYTADQNIQDAPHKDLRRARAAAVSQIPTTTGAATAVGKVIPELDGKLDGKAIRVPTPTGSLIDFVANLKKEVTVEDINKAMQKHAEGDMKGILGYTEDPIVSADIIGDERSSVFDAESTMVIGKTVKIISWYDNEWGYSNRVVDLVERLI
ncbi:MAG: type I glyceraldehyde-3-phosphate dehydrogenase [Bacteroidales bacterium]